MGSEAPRGVGQPSSTRSAVTTRVTARSAAEWAGEGGWRRELEGDRRQEESGAWRGTVPGGKDPDARLRGDVRPG